MNLRVELRTWRIEAVAQQQSHLGVATLAWRPLAPWPIPFDEAQGGGKNLAAIPTSIAGFLFSFLDVLRETVVSFLREMDRGWCPVMLLSRTDVGSSAPWKVGC
jgi:hypothetical protein